MLMIKMSISPNQVQKENQTKCNHPFLVIIESVVLRGLRILKNFKTDEMIRDIHYKK